MFRPIFAVAAAAAVLVAAGVAAAKSEEPITCVKMATSWDAAIDEAKTLNLPIVLHNHGFYCPPCWGMHKSVMCNDKYIDFAAENTVEVLALQDLQKGIDAKDRQAAEYDAKDEKGQPVKYMVEFPGLTREQIHALHTSKASTYNDTGGIPFTAIIDPFTEKEMQRFPGGGHSAKSIMEAVTAQRKVLTSAHGAGLSRAKLAKVKGDSDRIVSGLAKAGVAKSMAELRKAQAAVAKDSPALQAKFEPAFKAILEAAAKDLDAAQAAIDAGDVAGAKKIVDKLGKSLEDTDLASRLEELRQKTSG